MSLLKRILLILLSLSWVFLVSCGGTFLIIISNLNLGNGSRSTLQIWEVIGTIAWIILLIFSVYLAFLTFKKFIWPVFAIPAKIKINKKNQEIENAEIPNSL